MIYQRTITQLLWLLIIGLHGSLPLLYDDGHHWRSEYHRIVPFATNIHLMVMCILSVLFTIFWLFIRIVIMNQVKKKEENKESMFKSICDAIYYGRLNVITNRFDKPKHLTSHEKDGKSPLYNIMLLH